MEHKFLGLGLSNIIGCWLMFCFLTVMAKVVLTKHHVDGLSQFILTV